MGVDGGALGGLLNDVSGGGGAIGVTARLASVSGSSLTHFLVTGSNRNEFFSPRFQRKVGRKFTSGF